ncbi:MAG: FtsQ-type POTRA domain-containing protein [Ardenticatenaceae bacterium]|nr:FtsQ-type POTRA domain-containing protein [Ardenticatenaceae bacterium]
MRRQQRPEQPQTQKPRKLRKQPKMRRVQSATSVVMPPVMVPKTAAYRRKRNQRRRQWVSPLLALKKVIFTSRWISLGLLGLCVYALVLTGLSLHFYLTVIPVEGTKSLPPAEVVAASGLAGSHIFAADPNLAAQRITEMPGVISATVTLGWPNEVLIRIKEDSPIAIWQEGGRQFWITRDGRLIPARGEAIDLPVIVSEMSIVAEAAANAAAGEGEEMTPDTLPQTSLAFVPLSILEGVLQLRGLRPDVSQFYYRPSGGLSFDESEGWRVYFGVGQDMQQKMVVYQAIVTELQARELAPEYISVSNQEKPYYMAR